MWPVKTRSSAPTPLTGYVPDMSNLFGISLDQSWLRWAAVESVTETVIAAVALLHERSVEEIAGKLTSAELADVTRLVSRCPSCYPPGAYDALKALRNVAAEKPATPSKVGPGANCPPRRHVRASAELGPHTERAGLAEQINRAHDATLILSLEGAYSVGFHADVRS